MEKKGRAIITKVKMMELCHCDRPPETDTHTLHSHTQTHTHRAQRNLEASKGGVKVGCDVFHEETKTVPLISDFARMEV